MKTRSSCGVPRSSNRAPDRPPRDRAVGARHGQCRQLGELPDRRRVLFDDNSSPTDAFLWAGNRTKATDVQFNDGWVCASDPDAYTALWLVHMPV